MQGAMLGPRNIETKKPDIVPVLAELAVLN